MDSFTCTEVQGQTRAYFILMNTYPYTPPYEHEKLESMSYVTTKAATAWDTDLYLLHVVRRPGQIPLLVLGVLIPKFNIKFPCVGHDQ